MTRLKPVSRRQFRHAICAPRANWVPVDFRGRRPGIAIRFLLALVEFSGSSTNKRTIAFDFRRGIVVGVGFLLAALAEEPEDYADEGEGEGDADCAADDEAEVGF